MACYIIDEPDRRMFICGDLGPHCTSCAAPSDVLCDYPVGDGKTCDRPLCANHAAHVHADTDYCPDHYAEWQQFVANQGVLPRVKPPLARPSNER